MKFIQPSEISGKILTLIDEAEERLIIVSPYIRISKWYKLKTKLKKLRDRKTQVEVYVRDGPDNAASFKDLDALGLEYKKIPYLHCKLYMNESCAIASSMNLLLSSELKALDFAYRTETWSEYKELMEYFHRYVQKGVPVQVKSIAGRELADPEELKLMIREKLDNSCINAWPWFSEQALHIKTSHNEFGVFLKQGVLRISVDSKNTSKKAQEFGPAIRKKLEDLTASKIELYSHRRSGFLSFNGRVADRLKSTGIHSILKDEAAQIQAYILRFVGVIENFEKTEVRKSSGPQIEKYPD